MLIKFLLLLCEVAFGEIFDAKEKSVTTSITALRSEPKRYVLKITKFLIFIG